MPPELRLGEISAYRRFTIEFTNEMDFPDTDKFVQLNEESKLSLLNVMMISGEEEEVDQNLLSWTIVEVTSKKIDIDLEFD